MDVFGKFEITVGAETLACDLTEVDGLRHTTTEQHIYAPNGEITTIRSHALTWIEH